jgi:tetratricopeptide (TPR) repeat protein
MTLGSGAKRRLESRHVVWLAFAAALFVFLPSLLDGFVFDDDSLIVRNPYAHDTRYVARCFTTDLWDTPDRPDAASSTKFYRPLVCTSYILNYGLAGGAAWSFHLVNVLLHAAACALAARFALRWTGSNVAAFFAVLIFAIHPSRSENVVWVSGRTDLLMTVFLLAGHELIVASSARANAWLARSAAAACFFAALLCKEFAVCWPLLLGVEAVLEGKTGPDGARRKRLVFAALSALGVALVYLLIRQRTFPIRPAEVDAMVLPLVLHAGYVLLSIGYYVERILFPWPQTFHFRPVSIVNGVPSLFVPSVVLGALSLAGFTVWALRAYRRDKALAAILGVTLVVFLPIVNVSYTGFPGTTADRFLYLPLLPLMIAVGRTLRSPLERWTARPLTPLVTVAASLVFAGINWIRSLDYANDETVWRHELDVNPNNPQALAGLGQVLAGQGDIDGAAALIRRALTPEALQYRLLANPTRCYLGLLELQGARLADGNVTALRALFGEVMSLANGRPGSGRARASDLELALPDEEHALIHVANAAAHLNAAGALLASRLGDARAPSPYDGIVKTLTQRLGPAAPLDAAWRYNLALALGRGADYEGAKDELALATHLDPSPAVAAAAGELAASFEKVRTLRENATTLPEPDASVARAEAFLELGAYLRAARSLRPAHLAHPENAAASATYFSALVSARLDTEAESVARDMPGTDPAARLASARSALSRRTQHALTPVPGEDWWDSSEPP